jgi:hypothetical protein
MRNDAQATALAIVASKSFASLRHAAGRTVSGI